MSQRLPAAIFAALLLLSACGDDDDPDVAAENEPAVEDPADDRATAEESDGGGVYGGPTSESTSTADDEGDAAGTAPVTTAESEFGEILVDADGFTLYGFTNDTDGVPTCTGGCAETWPPLFVDSEELPEGLDPAVFDVVEHPSGEFQVKVGDWPLYLYAPDTEPGDTAGQGVGGVWFVVDPEGQLIRE